MQLIRQENEDEEYFKSGDRVLVLDSGYWWPATVLEFRDCCGKWSGDFCKVRFRCGSRSTRIVLSSLMVLDEPIEVE